VLHIREMRVRCEGSCVDVLGVNETFLRDSVSSRAVDIKGYKFVRNDRTVRGRTGTDSGGVGIYIRNSLPVDGDWSKVSVGGDKAVESGHSCRFGV
jgi:hypothetical protein